MKIRQSFVSNSSSSSFCIGKYFMTKEQIEDFRALLSDVRREGDYRIEDTYIYEGEHYFFGEISFHDTKLVAFFDENDLYQYIDGGD